jgi:carbon-monoxide dehydrogenase medium subunit
MGIEYYHRPDTISECIGLLTECEGAARLIAGGTDLMLDIESKRRNPRVLVDITSIKKFKAVVIGDDTIEIPAGVTHAQVNHHSELNMILPALSQACGSVGSPQIRNVATLSGNIVNAQPAADSAMVLIALGAKAIIEKPGATRIESVEDLFVGPGQSTIDSTSELLTTFIIEKPGKHQANAYGRISPRNSLCLPIVNTSVSLTMDEKGKISHAKIVMGPVAKTPLIAEEAQRLLIGGDIDDPDLYIKAAVAASRAANPRSSCLRGCTDYRRQLIYVLTKRIIAEAAEKAAAK